MPIPSTKFHPLAHCLMKAPPLSFCSVCGSHWVVLRDHWELGVLGKHMRIHQRVKPEQS